MFIASLQSFLHLMFRDLAAVVLSEGQKARHAASIIRLSSDPYKILSSAPAVAHVYIHLTDEYSIWLGWLSQYIRVSNWTEDGRLLLFGS